MSTHRTWDDGRRHLPGGAPGRFPQAALVIWAVAVKDMRTALTEKMSMIQAVTLPLNYLIMMALFVLSGSAAPVAVVMRDHGTYAREFLTAMEHARSFRITTQTQAQADAQMRAGTLVAEVTIPAAFSRQISQHRTGTVTCRINNLNQDLTDDARRGMRLALAGFYEAAAPGQVPVTITWQDQYGNDTGYIPYLALSITVIALMVAGLLQAGNAAAREWEDSTRTGLTLAPVPPWQVLAGRMAGAFTVSLPAAAAVIAVVIFLAGDHPARAALAIAVALLTLAVFCAAGTALGVIARDRTLVATITRAVPVPLFFASGVFSPLGFQTGAVQGIGEILPVHWAVVLTQATFGGFLTGTIPLAADAAILAGYLAAFAVIAAVAVHLTERARAPLAGPAGRHAAGHPLPARRGPGAAWLAQAGLLAGSAPGMTAAAARRVRSAVPLLRPPAGRHAAHPGSRRGRPGPALPAAPHGAAMTGPGIWAAGPGWAALPLPWLAMLPVRIPPPSQWLLPALAVCLKDLRAWLHRPWLVLGTLLVPLSYTLVAFLGSAATGASPVAVVDLDRGPDGPQIVRAINGAQVFRVHSASAAEAAWMYAQLQVAAVITIPADTTALISGHRHAQIGVRVDNLNRDLADDIRRAVPDALITWYTTWQHPGPVRVALAESRIRPQDVQLDQYTILPVITLVITVCGILVAGLAAAEEWERRTVQELLQAPCAPAVIIAGKIAAAWILTTTVAASVLLAGAAAGWTRPAGAGWAASLAAIALGSLSASGLGIAIGSWGRRKQPVSVAATIAAVELFALSGGLGVIFFEPGWLQKIAWWDPLTYMTHSLQQAVFYHSGTGAVRDCLVLAASAAVSAAAGTLAMHRHLST